MIRLKNISGGQIVCDLADGKTLRLDNKQEDTFNEKQVTKHIKNLVKKGLFLSSKVVEKQSTSATEKEKSAKKEKEVEKNGTV